MIQKGIAFIIIAFFLFRLYKQKKKNAIGKIEFFAWLFFWLSAAAAIVFLQEIDEMAARIGFSASGIDLLLYAGFAILFYLIFRIRIRMERIEKNITKLTREIAVNNPYKK